MKTNNIDSHILVGKYASLSRRSFLKGALAVGGALTLAGCNNETVTNTVTVTDKQTVTVTNTVTVTESAPAVPETPADVAPMINASYFILPDYTRCVGCHICMIECSMKHYGVPDMGLSNIQVYGLDIKGGMVDIPILCMTCKDAACMNSCPEKVAAISRDEATGALKIDHDKCTLCGLCIDACNESRTGCLRFNNAEDKVVGMCDRCDGNPACITYCPEDILKIISTTQYDPAKLAAKPEVLGERVYRMLYC